MKLAPRERRLDPMATPGIASVDEQGAPLAAGAVVPPGADTREALELEREEDAVAGEPAVHNNDEQGSASESSDAGATGTGAGTTGTGATGRPALMTIEPGQFEAPPIPRPDGYAFRLVTRRSLYDHGTLVQASPALAGLVPGQQLHLRPKTLEQLGVVDGDEIRIRSSRGELVVPVVADADVPAGYAVLPLNAVAVDEPSATVLLDAGTLATKVRLETLS